MKFLKKSLEILVAFLMVFVCVITYNLRLVFKSLQSLFSFLENKTFQLYEYSMKKIQEVF